MHSIDSSSTATLALDIGGTKIAYGIIPDDAPQEVLAEGRVPSQPVGGNILDQVGLALSHAVSQSPLKIQRVGIGAPGIVLAPQGEIIHSGPTIPGWQGSDLGGVVEKHLDAPVACHNDVRIWAFGEHHFGAGQGYAGRVLYVSLGTGVGGAIVDNGALLEGPTGSAGEISELVCADCRGLADRVENIASGPSLARYYEALQADPHIGQIPWTDPNLASITLPEVIARYRDGDVLAQQVIHGNLSGLGRCLGAVVSAWDLSAVVIGGGVAGIGDIIVQPIVEGLRASALRPNKHIPVLCSQLKGNAPLIAAAAYARFIHPNT